MLNVAKGALFLSILCLFAGCSTFEDIENGLFSLYGRHVDELVAKIGYPNGQNEVAGRKLYIWDSRQTFSYSMPKTSYSSGTMNTYSTYGNAYGTYGGTTTTWVSQVNTYNCTIIVEVDAAERISSAQFNGNIGGCEKYAAALRK